MLVAPRDRRRPSALAESAAAHRSRDVLVDWLARRGTCCSSSTTSSRWSTRRRSSPTCCAPRPNVKVVVDEPGRAARLGRAGVSRSRVCRRRPTRGASRGLERLNLPGRGARRSTRRRSASTRRSACSSSVPSPSGRASRSPTRTRRPSPRSAPGSTACRSRSSSRRRGSSSSSPDAILARLEHQLDVLAAGSRDLPERQQTLRGAIAWSYDLLDDGARRLLDRLSVFAGGCDLEAAEAVCGPASEIGGDVLDGLMALADQSLVKVDDDGRRRAALPDARHDPRVRRRAARGARRDGELIQRAPRDWFVALAERAAPAAVGRRPAALARPARARARQHPGRARPGGRRARTRRSRSGSRSRCGASGRSAATSPRRARRLEAMAAAPWSRDDPRLRARLLEALGGTLLVAGRDPADGPPLRRGARDLARHRR